MQKFLRIVGLYLLAPLAAACALGLAWLKIDSARPLEEYFRERHGTLEEVALSEQAVDGDQVSELVNLRSDSGLRVTLRAIRRATDERLPVLIVLGGHRTGSDAVDLFGKVGERAVVALDYPYDGPEKVRGFRQVVATLPLARKAFRDTPAAVSLAVDWLEDQSWANTEQVFVVGASLGVPFAALVAARDPRIGGAILVHGAADNQAWIEAQVARRNEVRILHRPVATLIHWLAYGPTFDTAANVALIAPRPVIIIGAREDERTPAGETEALYAAAGDPRVLRWTDGLHIEPDRTDIIEALLAIADEELSLLTTDR